jgi:hypothetical protein
LVASKSVRAINVREGEEVPEAEVRALVLKSAGLNS